MHKKIRLGFALAAVIITGWILFQTRNAFTPGDSSSNQQTTTENKPFNKSKYSLSDPSSLWVVVNKQRALPADYTPSKLRLPNVPLRNGSDEMLLRNDAASALERMILAAKRDGVNLLLASGFRSYSLQTAVYNNFVAQDGQTNADRYSARPGHSEHQTGLAADVGGTNGVCQLEQCFGNTPEGKWVAKNAHKFGFVIRYQKGKESIVGYSFEPWHLRYVDTGLATEIYKQKTTLEQYFGLPAAPNYN